MKFIIAIILILIGLLMRYISIKTLGKDFSLILQIPSKVCKIGIYKYLKHPAYYGSMLIILGTSLISPIIGILITAYAFYKSRIVVEDEIIKRCENG